jgi:hypothetical protein
LFPSLRLAAFVEVFLPLLGQVVVYKHIFEFG